MHEVLQVRHLDRQALATCAEFYDQYVRQAKAWAIEALASKTICLAGQFIFVVRSGLHFRSAQKTELQTKPF